MADRVAATLSDVARLAQVSIGTASKALNGRGAMRPETRQRVQEAARALRFAPNMQARSLQKGRTGTVGLITDDLNGRFSLPVLAGAEDALGAGHLSILLCDSRGDAIREQHHLRLLLGRRVDGLIVVGQSADPRPSLGPEFPVPVVYAYSPSLEARDVSVTTDDVASGRLATEHVLSVGRRRVVYIGGDPTYVAAERRAEGGELALRAAGLRFAAPPMFGAWSEEWGRAAVRTLVGGGIPFDALTCGSDQIARGALDALLMLGRRVPEEVAVVGHDNWEVFAAHSQPPLTSVDMNLAQVGSRAAHLLARAWEGDAAAGPEQVPARLVVRATTA
jgi:LacI family transcriptional regulator